MRYVTDSYLSDIDFDIDAIYKEYIEYQRLTRQGMALSLAQQERQIAVAMIVRDYQDRSAVDIPELGSLEDRINKHLLSLGVVVGWSD